MMKHRSKAPSRWRVGIVGTALAAGLGLFLLVTPAGDRLVHLSYDLHFALRPDLPVTDVVIVQMDEESHRVLKQPGAGPWDRALHARLIEQLGRWDARAIAFDVLFYGERDPVADAALVRAAKGHGRVAVAALMQPEFAGGQVIGWQLMRPFPALAAVARVGAVEGATDDRMVRQHHWNPQFSDTLSLAWETARLATNPAPSLGGERWVNYYGPPGQIQRVSFHQVMSGGSTLAPVFSNKVVFVGAGYTVGFTHGKAGDEFRTPYTRWTGRFAPGVEVVATTYLNLVREDWLVRLPPLAECAVMLLAAAILGFCLTSLSPIRAALLAVGFGLVVAATAHLTAWNLRVWFPWAIVVVGQIPLALAWTWLANARRLQQEKHSLEQRLAFVTAAGIARNAAPGTAQALPVRVSSALHTGTSADKAATELNPPSVPDHTLLRRVGAGAYGEVWLARDVLGSFHAVKLVHRQRFHDDRPLERELEGLKRFTPISRLHPNLIQILHVGLNPDCQCIYSIMEAADDEFSGSHIDEKAYSPKSLASVLKRQGPLPIDECLQLSIDLASAIDFLHQRGLVHRDIKPANVIFANGTPKLADIGLVAEADAGSGTTLALGTPGYMPPEGPGTPVADIYSFGKLIYETAFGFDCLRFPDLPRTLLQEGGKPAAFKLNRILLKACENQPARRHQSAAELLNDLRRLRETPVQAARR